MVEFKAQITEVHYGMENDNYATLEVYEGPFQGTFIHLQTNSVSYGFVPGTEITFVVDEIVQNT